MTLFQEEIKVQLIKVINVNNHIDNYIKKGLMFWQICVYPRPIYYAPSVM